MILDAIIETFKEHARKHVLHTDDYFELQEYAEAEVNKLSNVELLALIDAHLQK